MQDRQEVKQSMIDRGETGYELKPLAVWTSTRRRTIETARYLYEQGYKIRQRSQLRQLNPGVCEKMSERRMREEFGDEVTKHELDPYHHRYPRAEVSLLCLSSCPVITFNSPIMTSLYDSNRSSWNSNASKKTFSSLRTKVCYGFCTATSWRAMPQTFLSWISHATKSSR